MTKDDAYKTAKAMSSGRYGAFATYIGKAYLVADRGNMESLLEAFQSLFQRVSQDISNQAL
jgi:hypothetical protein